MAQGLRSAAKFARGLLDLFHYSDEPREVLTKGRILAPFLLRKCFKTFSVPQLTLAYPGLVLYEYI